MRLRLFHITRRRRSKTPKRLKDAKEGERRQGGSTMLPQAVKVNVRNEPRKSFLHYFQNNFYADGITNQRTNQRADLQTNGHMDQSRDKDGALCSRFTCLQEKDIKSRREPKPSAIFDKSGAACKKSVRFCQKPRRTGAISARTQSLRGRILEMFSETKTSK